MERLRVGARQQWLTALDPWIPKGKPPFAQQFSLHRLLWKIVEEEIAEEPRAATEERRPAREEDHPDGSRRHRKPRGSLLRRGGHRDGGKPFRPRAASPACSLGSPPAHAPSGHAAVPRATGGLMDFVGRSREVGEPYSRRNVFTQGSRAGYHDAARALAILHRPRRSVQNAVFDPSPLKIRGG